MRRPDWWPSASVQAVELIFFHLLFSIGRVFLVPYLYHMLHVPCRGCYKGFGGVTEVWRVLRWSWELYRGLESTCRLWSCNFFSCFVFTKVALRHLRPQLLQQPLQNQIHLQM